MTDSESTLEDASASRRALLKGAVGAGVGLAAWSAPKIGTIPAYALTNSAGLFNGTCYFLSFRSQSANRWQRGQSTSPSVNQGRASSINRITNTNAEYVWAGALPNGDDLMVTAVGNPVTGTATITLVGAPARCSFATPAAGVNFAQTMGNYTDDRPGSQTCTPSGNPTTGTYSLVGSDIQMSGVTAGAPGQSVIIFNIVCT